MIVACLCSFGAIATPGVTLMKAPERVHPSVSGGDVPRPKSIGRSGNQLLPETSCPATNTVPETSLSCSVELSQFADGILSPTTANISPTTRPNGAGRNLLRSLLPHTPRPKPEVRLSNLPNDDVGVGVGVVEGGLARLPAEGQPVPPT